MIDSQTGMRILTIIDYPPPFDQGLMRAKLLTPDWPLAFD